MTVIPAEQPRYDLMQEAVERYIKNEKPTSIAREMGISRKQVLDYIDEWKESAVNQELMRDRVQELIATMDEHYSTLIRKFYEIVEEVDAFDTSNAAMLAQKANALKGIAELERQRIDTLQKSGLLDAADMGAEVARMEEKHAILIDILQNDLCRVCKPKVMERLSSVTGQPTVIVTSE